MAGQAMIEKQYGKNGNLRFARGPAVEIHEDEELQNLRLTFFIPGEPRAFHTLVPRNLAGRYIHGPENLEPPGPYNPEQFALMAGVGTSENPAILVREISGSTILEVRARPVARV